MAVDPNEPGEWKTPASEDPDNPKNPPNSLLRKDTRRTAVMSYVGPVVALFVIAGIALIYWANRPAGVDPNERDRDAVGTGGQAQSPGGFDPQPSFKGTNDELEHRGVGDKPDSHTPDIDPAETLTSVGRVIGTEASGKQVTLEDVEVVSASEGHVWVRDEDAQVQITAPQGVATLKPGMHVDIVGSTERGADNVITIRATEIRKR